MEYFRTYFWILAIVRLFSLNFHNVVTNVFEKS
jgi:hypothetical protein